MQFKKPLRFSYSKHTGYDISIHGNNRFCKTVARLSNGKTIEEEFKDRTKDLPSGEPEAYYPYLLDIYREWVNENPVAFKVLLCGAVSNSNCVRDKLAVGVLTHARALTQLLNEHYPT